jgi:hypothetical protein
MHDLEAAISDAYAAAQEVWPGCTLTAERFHGELVRRLGGAIDPAKLRGVCTADVYLAISALDGDPVDRACGAQAARDRRSGGRC